MKKSTLIALCLFAALPLLAQQKKEYKAYVVSNAHLDTQWNWDIQTTINDYIPKTLRQNLWLIENHPDYIFNFEGAVKYNWMKEYYPLSYERVCKAIRDGRWHVSGSSWDANDTNVPSPESLFRNILLGQEFYKKEFGIKSTDIFLPDCFGFSYVLPTVAAHCGLIGFSTQKLGWRKHPFYGEKREPFPIGMWQGIDGSAIQCAFDCGSYVYNFPEGDLTENPDLIARAKRGVNNTAYRYFGAGDTGGSPSVWSAIAIEKALKGGKGPVEIISASSDQLYKDYIAAGRQDELPRYDGELLMDVHATGCYTSQAAMKRFNRRNEQLADAAERASVMADWFGAMPYPAAKLTEAWQRFIWHQFHDDLTGTSIQRAYTFSWNDELIAQSQFADIMQTASGAVAQGLDTRVKGTPVVVYNPAAYARTSLVEASVPMTRKPQGISVYGPDRKAVPAQLLSYENGAARILFAADVAPVGYTVYDVRSSGRSTHSQTLRATGNTLENPVYKITLNAAGDIASIVDKRANRELVKKGETVGLALFKNNESSDWPAWEIAKATLDAQPEPVDGKVNISVAEAGPLRATLRVEKQQGDSRYIQYISLTDGASDDRIDVVSEIDWAEKNALLKASFPWSVGNPEATYDLGLGHIRRGNNTATAYEVYAQHWADITAPDGNYGVSVLNDSKYGWDKPDDNTLRLTLFHTPHTAYRYAHQEVQDFGHHRIACSIVGHEGNCIEAGVIRHGEELNQPLIPYVADKHPGELGRSFSFIRSNTPQIAVKALKKAEDGAGYIVRVYETEGRPTDNAKLAFPAPIRSACEVNGIEEDSKAVRFEGCELSVEAGKFQPKTYRVTLAEPSVSLAAPESRFVEIPCNVNSISPDGFRPESNVDNRGNSYAAELLPETIVNDGIRFRRGKLGVPNAVRCQGQVIALPQDKAYTKLYLLAAATDRDRHADFSVDGKPYGFDVPYYSDFFGQWGQQTVSEGYVKHGKLAHVGTHRHNAVRGNDAYVFTYLYQLGLDIEPGAKELRLPEDAHIVVFAVTVAIAPADRLLPAAEVRALPKETAPVAYVRRNAANLAEGADVVGLSNPRRIEQEIVPQWALDGNEATFWKDTWNDVPGAPKYMEIDLGAPKTFSTWKVLHEGKDGGFSILRDFKIMIRESTSGTWKTIDEVTGNTRSVTERKLAAPAEARYVRLEITQGNAEDNTSAIVREFALYL